MRLFFCADPLESRQPDPDYATEVTAAQALGAHCDLISYEALVNDGDAEHAIRRLAPPNSDTAPELAVYRGWMLRPPDYAQLYEALLARGLRLINDPAAYTHTHYLPESYPLIAQATARTVWLSLPADVTPETLPMDDIFATLAIFGDAPVIVKDYVKSRKHEWAEATYIPSAADHVAVERVVRRFVELQGPDLAGGLVFRAFERYTPLGRHSKSGMPLTQEYRVFWLDGEPLSAVPYWDADRDVAGDDANAYPLLALPLASFQPIAQRIQSRFFTMDIAPRAEDGAWRIIELGDGQVAGLPGQMDVTAFYATLLDKLQP